MPQLFGKVVYGLNAVASVWVCVLMVLITADVAARNFFGAPIQGVVEMVKLSVVGMTWAMAAYTLRSGGHLRSNILLQIMPRPMKAVILLLNCLIGAALMAITCYLGFRETLSVYATGDYEGAAPVRLVIWPAWALLTLGSGLMGIQFLLDFLRIARFGPSQVDDAGEGVE